MQAAVSTQEATRQAKQKWSQVLSFAKKYFVAFNNNNNNNNVVAASDAAVVG